MGAIAEKINSQPEQKQKKSQDPARTLVKKMQPAIERALPRHMDGDRFTRIMLTCIKSTPKLAECLGSQHGQMTLLGALMQCAQLGLEPGPLGHAYILPFWNSKEGCREAQFIPGYKGLIDLARRSGHVQTIYANEVRENDDFTFSYGIGGTLEHKPSLREERGEVIGFYGFAQLEGDAYQYTYMRKDEVNAIRDQYSQSAGSSHSPWNTAYVEMGKKTAIKRLAKTLPVSVEYHDAVQHDERALRYEDGEVIDITTPDSEPKQIEQEDTDDVDDYSGYGKWQSARRSLSQMELHGHAREDVEQAIADEAGVDSIEQLKSAKFEQAVEAIKTVEDRKTGLDELCGPADESEELPV